METRSTLNAPNRGFNNVLAGKGLQMVLGESIAEPPTFRAFVNYYCFSLGFCQHWGHMRKIRVFEWLNPFFIYGGQWIVRNLLSSPLGPSKAESLPLQNSEQEMERNNKYDMGWGEKHNSTCNWTTFQGPSLSKTPERKEEYKSAQTRLWVGKLYSKYSLPDQKRHWTSWQHKLWQDRWILGYRTFSTKTISHWVLLLNYNTWIHWSHCF